MSLRTIDLSMLSATIVLLLLAITLPQILNYSDAIFLTSILLVGIPHGAVDHIIHFRNKSETKSSKVNFYVRYIGLIALVAVCWYLSPLVSFIAFLLVSAYHFGQSQLFYINGQPLFRGLIFTTWGAFILSVIVVMNYEEVLVVLSSLEWLNITAWMSARMWLWITVVSGLLMASSFAHLYFKNFMTGRQLLFELLVILSLVLLSAYTNAAFAFAIYFGLWHSLRSLFMEYRSLTHNRQHYSVWRFLKDVVPFSVLAISFLVVSYYVSTHFVPELSPYMLFIIVISTLTVPHLMVMNDLYDNHQAEINGC